MKRCSVKWDSLPSMYLCFCIQINHVNLIETKPRDRLITDMLNGLTHIRGGGIQRDNKRDARLVGVCLNIYVFTLITHVRLFIPLAMTHVHFFSSKYNHLKPLVRYFSVSHLAMLGTRHRV